MLKSSNTTADITNTEQTLTSLVNAACEKYSDQTAFVCGDSKLSFSEVDEGARNVAAALASHLGLAKGDRVALMAPNILAFPIITFGILRAGLVQVNVNPLYTAQELRHQLQDSDASTIFIHEAAAPTLAQIISETSIRRVIVIRNDASAPLDGFSGLKSSDVSVVAFSAFLEIGRENTPPDVDIQPSDLAFLQYTGGTTGFSKGAMLSHGNVAANVLQFAEFTKGYLTPGSETVITAIPLYHIFALTVNMISMLHLGGTNVVVTNPRDMGAFVDQWAAHPISFATGVNTLFNGLLNHPKFATLDFSALKFVIGGGAPVQAAVSERWRAATGSHLKEGYGLSETSPVLTVTPLNEEDFHSSIGQPIPGTELSIRDDNGAEVAQGEPGELCARGPQVMQGYWNNTEATKAAMTEDGFFRTGDIAEIGEDGRLRIVDRKKDMILVSGFNVYPNEIEAIVAQLDGVQECACIGAPDEKTGESVALFLSKKDPGLTENTVLEHCKANLTRYKVPTRVTFIEEIPKSSVGKILRRSLVDYLPQGSA